MITKNHEEIQLPINWNIPEDIVARYATNMVIQRLENEFLISFFEIKPPIIIDSPEKVIEKLKDMKLIQANCVAQIIIAHNKLPSFIDALKRNFDRSSPEDIEK